MALTSRPDEFEFFVVSPGGPPDAMLAIAGCRAGALGVVNLEFTTDTEAALGELGRLSRSAHGRWGVLVRSEELLANVLAGDFEGLGAVLISSRARGRLGDLVAQAHAAGLKAYPVASTVEEARAAEAGGADAVIAKGHEAGGWIGDEGSFVLLQRILAGVSVPVWAGGGIGLHTAAAAYVAGAAGVVLDSQVLLTRESPLSESARSRIASMDGSETAVVGSEIGAPLRVYARPRLSAVNELRELEKELGAGDDADAAGAAWIAEVERRVGWDSPETCVLPIGQDAAFAAPLAARFETVGGVVAALREAVADACETVRKDNPLREGGPLAVSHGTRYPIVQGPMTRVSDRAEFAAAVAEGGALPFLALALMRGPEVDVLLEETSRLLGERPWGVGILGFVPQELRAEQLEVIRAHRPPFALIAGGRPDQARALEDEGITTYLHVPSPALLKLYLADGARRFVFEGRECGGHVGPRTSFVLWDCMVRTLLEELPAASPDCDVLLAGGIHDATSAAMAATTTAAATAAGIRAGVLLGTAYLFTPEATDCGAITPTFQKAALAGDSTVLLESGPGHATRCIPSPYFEQFEAEKRRLHDEGASAEELRGQLERLNIGRLRIASKGLERRPGAGNAVSESKLAPVDARDQWDRGMYMIGQVAALRDRTVPLAGLHAEVSAGSTELLRSVDPPRTDEPPAPPPADVAIIGVGCVLPAAPDVATFWSNILDKVDAIGEVPADRWDWRRYYDPDPAARDKVYSRWGGFVDDVHFDAIEFGLPPSSLTSIEPFQLLALTTAQAALRDAGYATRPFGRDRTSVILGAGGGGADLSVGYTVRSAMPSLLGEDAPELSRALNERLPEWTEDTFPGLLMNVAAGRIANRLDLGGANYTVDAACASSLTAVSLGVRELQAATSDMVLVGGVDAIQNPFAYLCFSKTHALSPTGHCKPFDAAADGIAISEGFATLVLKRLADAERDGDRIYAVIRGVGAASDGRDRSLTAPRPEGQMRALRRAYAQARVSPATVELVEAHGTGTVAGDTAEVEALSTVFRAESSERQWCAIGSVKSMIGHTKATAGVAGLAKAALALHHRVLPPTIGVTEPNPKAGFGESPFYVNSEARPWLRGAGSHPRRAGVSAFGFGGTDFHVVLEEYVGDPLAARTGAMDRWPAELFVWRGTRREITADVERLAAGLAGGAPPSLADLAFTLALEAGSHGEAEGTLAVVAASLDDLREKLDRAGERLREGAARVHEPNGVHWAEHRPDAEGRVAFLFPGQGSQEVDMGRELALAFTEALDCFERADQVLGDRYEQPLSRYIFPPPSFTHEDLRRRQEELTETNVAQAALGATELAYVHVLRALGLEPEMVAGHSYGELVALCVAGSLTEDDLLRLSEARGRLMREAAAGEAGAMAAVDAPPEALRELLEGGHVVAANLNAPTQTVLSGAREAVDDAIGWCRARDIRAAKLPVACAFHSPHVAGAGRRFVSVLAKTPLVPPSIPVFSNTTGESHGDDPAAIAAVLGEHLLRPVEFVREVEAMYREGARVFVEVGPRSVLTGLVGRILGDREHVAVAAHRSGASGVSQFLECLAALTAEGAPVLLERLFTGRSAQRIDLSLTDAAEPPGPATWLVNGGRARPALESSSPPVQEEPFLTTSTTNGASASPTHGTAPERADIAPVVSVAEPAPAPSLPAVAVSGDRVSDVMARYQAVMEHFLETERAVMIAYLGGQRPGAAMAAASVLPARAAPALPPPAAPPPPAPLTTPPPVAASAPQETTASAASPPAANGHASIGAAEIKDRLLAIVSERTGYPAEMLELDADLEGDLGIDSIKRVEIAGTLSQTVALPEGASIDVEELTASRTLRQVIAVLEAVIAAPGGAKGDPGGETPMPIISEGTSEETRPFELEPADEERIGRFVLQAASAPANNATGALASTGAVVIVDDETGVGEALADALARRNEPTLLTTAEEPANAEAAARLAERLRATHGGVKALVHLAALGGETDDAGVAALLRLAQALQPDLQAAAAAGGAAVLGATRLGGAFGVGGVAEGSAIEGTVTGFLKTLAQEWPDVRVKAVDLSPVSPEEAATHLLDELAVADGVVEIGYRGDDRTGLELAPVPLDDRADEDPLGADSVVLVTGGARGITAEVAISLAERYQPTLVIVGRTPAGAGEDDELAGLTELPALRTAIIERRRRDGSQVTPGLVEAECRSLLQQREVRENLARLARAGASVEYLTCDVRDPGVFGALIDGVYATHGRIDGVIHGAGVIEDRLVRDKDVESLRRVLATKAGSALTLARRLRPEGLRFLVFFGSVSGRFGNRGQADYAAASEVLNKLAAELDPRWPGRVVSINWGPWRSSGMVSPEVARQFASRGVALIPVDTGCRLLDEELRRGRKGETEVVIGAAAPAAGPLLTAAPAAGPLLTAATGLERKPDGSLVALRRFELDHDRYLDDHRVDGRPVLPFAVAMELMAEAAAAARPSLEVVGLRDIRLLHGVTVAEPDGAAVRIAVTPTPSAEELEAAIAMPDGSRAHYRAIARLRRRGAPADEAGAAGPELGDLAPFPTTVEAAYRELLFHGPIFQGIVEVEGMDERGAVSLLRPSTPQQCLAGASEAPWLLDPVLLDSALQVQVVWARLHWDVTLLPAEIRAHWRARPASEAVIAPGELVRHELRLRPGSERPLCRADHRFYLSDGRLLATLEDVVGVGTTALNRLAGAGA